MTDHFIQWDIGSVASTYCELGEPLKDVRPVFVRMQFDRFNRVVFPTGMAVDVNFISKGDLQAIRARFQSAGWSNWGLPLVRLQRSEDEHLVRLDFMFPATVMDIQGQIPMLLDSAVLQEVFQLSDQQAHSDLLEHLVLNSGFGQCLVREAPGFIEDETALDAVKLLLTQGYWLCCRLQSNERGNLYLHATEVKEVARGKVFKEAPRVHLIPISAPGIVLIPSPADASVNNLVRLRCTSSPIVMAWSQYHRLVMAEKTRLFEKRAAKPLVYRAPVSDGNIFRVGVSNWADVRSTWCIERLRTERETKVDISVKIKKTIDASENEGIISSIERVDYDGNIWIDTNGKIPPESGVILANKESDRPSEKREDAVKRLQSGQVALPVLLDILNDPSLAGRTRRRDGIADHRGLNERQCEGVERSVCNQSIMVIQGPPGTGKTKVIVEVISYIFRSRRPNESLRVLISSTQNEAVFNAMTKLQGEGVLIYPKLAKKAEDRARHRGLLQRLSQSVEEVKLKLETKFQSSVEFTRILSCLEASDQLLLDLESELETLEAIVNYLETICRRWEQHPIVSMLNAWGESSSLLVELQSSMKTLENRVKAPLAKSTITRLSEILNQAEPDLSIVTAIQILREEGESLALEVDAGILESMHEEAKSCSRAFRDGELKPASDHWGKMRELVQSAVYKSPIDPADLYLSSTLDRFYSWQSRCLAELLDLRENLGATRAGVIANWKSALYEDPRLWEELCERYSQVVGATTQMAAPSRTADATEWFDYVIIDEAGRSDLFDLLIPMTLGRRILLVGDQQQLPPFIDTALLANCEDAGTDATRIMEYESKLAQETLFRELFERLPEENRIMLNVQYRMHPIIGDTISEAFYGGELTSGPEDRTSLSYQSWLLSKHPLWGLYDNHPLVWVDSAVKGSPRTSDRNEREVQIIRDLVSRAVATTPQSGSYQSEPFIGVISFYSEQVRLLEATLALIPGVRDMVNVGTVDSFQGKEFPLVILSCCRHDPLNGNVGFLNLFNRLNVALSRAQRQLIIVGSRATLLHADFAKGSQPLKKFCSAAADNLKYIDQP